MVLDSAYMGPDSDHVVHEYMREHIETYWGDLVHCIVYVCPCSRFKQDFCDTKTARKNNLDWLAKNSEKRLHKVA